MPTSELVADGIASLIATGPHASLLDDKTKNRPVSVALPGNDE